MNSRFAVSREIYCQNTLKWVYHYLISMGTHCGRKHAVGKFFYEFQQRLKATVKLDNSKLVSVFFLLANEGVNVDSAELMAYRLTE